jgi:CheY-like chemotaxis protein
VTLPVIAPEHAPVDALCGRERPDGPSVVLAGVRVLVVDDDPDARELLGLVLHEAGADVHTVDSVRTAVGEVATFHPDLLVSDIGMPGEDGYALIREVRAQEPTDGGRLPAIALTAFASNADREEALARGFDAHLAKPAKAGDLMKLAASLLGRTPA